MALQNNHTQTSDIENSSSDEDLQIFYIPGSERYLDPDLTCSICHRWITKTCHTNACLHQFCFHCLKHRATVSAICPLCEVNFTKIYYKTTVGYYRIHEVPNSHLVQLHCRRTVITPRWTFEGGPQIHYDISELEIRRQVYTNSLKAKPLRDLNGAFRPFNSDLFGRNTINYSSLQNFVRREITAITSLIHTYIRYGSERIKIEHILFVAMHSIIDLEGVTQCTMIEAVLGRLTNLFLNEIFNFIRSPYNNLTDYDRNVKYRQDPSMIQNIIITVDSNEDSVIDNSDDENLRDSSTENRDKNEPTGNILNSTTDDNDEDSISNSKELFNSLGRDQPSTSTDTHSNGYTQKLKKVNKTK